MLNDKSILSYQVQGTEQKLFNKLAVQKKQRRRSSMLLKL